MTKQTNSKSLSQMIGIFRQSSDFKTMAIALPTQKLYISYYSTLIDESKLQHDLIWILQESARENPIASLEDLLPMIPMTQILISNRSDEIHDKLMRCHVLIQLKRDAQEGALVHIPTKFGIRPNNDTENEFSVVGPKVGFIEDIDTNIHLMRLQINIPEFVVKEVSIGSLSHTRVAMLYIDGVTNPEIVNRLEQRLRSIDLDVSYDSCQVDQLVADSSMTPFPLLLATERRDRVVFALASGQAAFICDGSPYFIIGPSTLFDFFISPEDYYLPWVLGSFFRLIRMFGVVFSLFASALYVAILTYHYEVVPHSLLGPLIYSRIHVPFLPVLEVIFLEITIEFLREAGARLPTKIGQTLGIVGGIVVGQAAVEAALTSNVLIIIVSLSALASFATPIYKMANTIRFLRFPFILLAAVWGGLGIFIGICFLFVHLTRLKSLGYPYTTPVYPLRPADFKDSFLRMPFQQVNRRPGFLRPVSKVKYSPKPVKRHKQDWN
ncbi:spore germination protein [Paenibacillus sp. R14(2021)]|uniref:spore germination protein n=1 Tax=Paenibacillus sp. R14(2021) TaxID=2859228 RepID=UPI001C611E2F|nr:spore germination protein [Paenibacillus sp. R14(2021)]